MSVTNQCSEDKKRFFKTESSVSKKCYKSGFCERYITRAVVVVRVKTLGAFIFHKRHITGGGVWGGCGGVD
jgi:hypothetical protein